MTQRKQLISRRPFAPDGASIAALNWIERLNTLQGELTSEVPCLKSLKASVLQLNFEPSSTHVWLAAYLVEPPQPSLNFRSSAGDADLFEEDCARAREDLSSIESRMTLAISPGIDPSGDIDIVTTRERLKKSLRSGPVVTWSTSESETLPLQQLPSVLPVGASKSVPVQVLSMSKIWAKVVLLEDIYVELTELFRIERGSIMKLTRRGEFREAESGAILQNAMDGPAPLMVEVVVVLDWSSGKPQELELTGFAQPIGNDGAAK
jgi:hypothetical protein